VGGNSSGAGGGGGLSGLFRSAYVPGRALLVAGGGGGGGTLSFGDPSNATWRDFLFGQICTVDSFTASSLGCTLGSSATNPETGLNRNFINCPIRFVNPSNSARGGAGGGLVGESGGKNPAFTGGSGPPGGGQAPAPAHDVTFPTSVWGTPSLCARSEPVLTWSTPPGAPFQGGDGMGFVWSGGVGGGGGGGFFGGNGGFATRQGVNRFDAVVMGGGGGSGYVAPPSEGVLSGRTIGGTGTTPPKTTDPAYVVAGSALGGAVKTSGGNGLVVICWPTCNSALPANTAPSWSPVANLGTA
jgi:hypothetical protein